METAVEVETLGLTSITDLSGALSQRVYQTLQEAILTMGLLPGAILRKSSICKELGVSRQPVSEAIARLAADGLVDVVPQSGTRVTPFSVDELHEAAFLREALEKAAVAKVAVDHTVDQLAQLTRNVRLQQLLLEDGDHQGFYNADEEFHALLMEFTGYPALAATVGTISLKLKRTRILLLPETGRSKNALEEHRAILDAVKAKDADAAQNAVSFHLSQLPNRFAPLAAQYPQYFKSR